MAENPLGRIMEMPRNPARAPGPLEQLVSDATVNPLWEIAQGVGAAASGYGNSPEAGAGMMAGIGFMSPMQRLMRPIRAYHASPHDFDRFDLSKIGTGQGSQSYGHGIYVAENPAVSGRGGQYDQEFSRGLYATSSGKQIQRGEAFQQLYNATPNNMHPDHRSAVVSNILQGLDDKGSVKKYLGSIEPPAMHRDAYAAVGAKAKEMGLGPGKAHIYEVDIHAKPEQFLDWDKPLSAQGSGVQSALSNIKVDNVFKQDPLGQYLHSKIGESRPDASRILNDAGIPGIKYLDQGSRPPTQSQLDKARSLVAGAEMNGDAAWIAKTKGDLAALEKRLTDQTSNYVLFNDSIIEIMKKYGLTGAVAGPLGALLAGGNNQAQAGQ